MQGPVALVILDGFGYSEHKTFNAIYHADTPFFDYALDHYSHTLLQASGTAVGLLQNQIGNSEVGHLTIGAGRITEQPVRLITHAIDDGSFFTNQKLIDFLHNAKKTSNTLHLMGLVSDGGVHSFDKHLFALLKAAQQHNIDNVYIHAFLDGRDVPPQSAQKYLKKLEEQCKQYGIGTLATIHGRYYAMDRDNNWQRTKKSYDVLTNTTPQSFSSWQEALDHYYQHNITDEFIPPTRLTPDGIIGDNDSVIFFNFRPDRARQLTESFLTTLFDGFKRQPIALQQFGTMTPYNDYPATAFFEPITIKETLKEILQQYNKTMFSIAETEKYAHVTYFFNGGREEKLPNETRILIPSIAAKNYAEHPAMSAAQITDSIIHSLQSDPKNFYLINYANADMVGHSGNFNATIKAIEYLDRQLRRLYEVVVQQNNGILCITADHGNAEDMFDEETQQPKTAHTANPVYFIVISNQSMTLPSWLNGLSDIAPFILALIQIPIPDIMKKGKQ